MKSLILRIYSRAYKAKVLNNYKKKNKFLWLCCLLTMHLMRASISLYMYIYRISGVLPSGLKSNENVSVSLTSFPARIDKVWMTIDSLFRQRYLPNSINLYLSLEEFPNKLEDVPSSLKRYLKLGLNIHFVEGNIKPHKKYFYIFKEADETANGKIFVTVDDDVYYLPDMLSNLILLHQKHPNSVCSNIVHRIKKNKPYALWDNQSTPDYPANEYIAIGCGGIIYDTELFKNKYFLDIPLIQSLCPIADDIWLKGAELVNKIPVVTGQFNVPFIDLIGTQKQALWKKNTNSLIALNNDTQWNAMLEYLKQNNLYT